MQPVAMKNKQNSLKPMKIKDTKTEDNIHI